MKIQKIWETVFHQTQPYTKLAGCPVEASTLFQTQPSGSIVLRLEIAREIGK